MKPPGPKAPVVLVKWYDYAKWLLGRVENFPKSRGGGFHLSAQAAACDALSHVDNGHHLQLIGVDTVNNPVGTFMHLAQAGLDKFMDGVSSGGHRGCTFDAGDQAINLQTSVVLRIASDEAPDRMQIAPRLP